MGRVFPMFSGRRNEDTGGVAETEAARRVKAWPRIRRAAAGAVALGFVVAFTAWLTVLVGSQPEFAPSSSLTDPLLPPGVLVIIVGVAFVAVGALLLVEPGQRGNGALFAATGVLYAASWVSPPSRGAWAAVAIYFSGALTVLCLGWVLLRYPEQRLSRRYERAFVIVGAAWLIGWQGLVTITWPPLWVDGPQAHGWPWWLPSHQLNQVAQRMLEVGAVALHVGFIVLMIMRFFRTRGLDRALYWPTYVAAGAWAIAAMVNGLLLVGRPYTWYVYDSPPAYYRLEWLALLAIPVVLLYGVLRRRLARLRVADLVMRVNAAASPDGVQEALSRTLADPGLRVLFWSTDEAGYIDVHGRPAAEQPTDGRLAFPVTNRNGEPVAMVHADASVAHYRELLDAALAASSLSLENAALHASLLARLAEVRESRARLAETAVVERRRIERDLHDGAQQALLALGLTLGRAQAAADAATASGLLTQARGELTEALQELRDLASGLHPAVLTQLGLGPALEVVAERLPVPVTLAVPSQRWPEAAETTAYFIACETLANIVKHADAKHVRITVADRTDRLMLKVTDDGRGGAHLELGHGLLGMRDRASAIGGTLTIASPPGQGTALEADLPCE
jgi:signal transduction histidine kinase